MAKNSILDLLLDQTKSRGQETACLVKADGKYGPVTWNQLWADARKVGKALIAAGIESGDRVNVIAHTCYRWISTDMGILAAGGVTVPIYPSNLPDECQYVTDHSGARLVFAQNADQVAKFIEQRDNLAGVVKVVQWEGEVASDDGWVITWDAFLAAGESVSDEQLDARSASLSPDSILTIIYTSGTTGRPKGVVLTHSNMLYEAKATAEIGLLRTDDIQLLFLPMAHVFAKVLEIGWLGTGHVLAFAESMNTIRDNLGEVRPTLMAGVPRVYEKFYAAVVDKGMAAEGIKKKMFEGAMRVSALNGELEEKGEKLGLIDSAKFGLLKKTVFSKVGEGIQAILGGRMRAMVSGGAPLSKKIAWFFRDAGIVLVEGYGMTESSAATTIGRPTNNRIGTVGEAMPGTKIKIAEDGEVLIQGPGVMREYWRNEEATKETIIDGWLHTGDIGELDDRTQTLRITDRKKDLIITAGGKNIPPQRIENAVKVHKLISQCVVHGDRRKFISALITLDEQHLTSFAKDNGLSGSYAELSQDPKVRAEIERVVAESNAELASYETIKKFKILDADLSIETGELTAKLSVKRKVVSSKFGHIFDGFYAESFKK
ncbi:AMP-dependent synthetase and ligase [Plesiocystis pacifica SIR-1]|uniref:AMP-dependent synthetase and ligase n=1 Tax=Plesiocystis pacifica SIR-1 TaxID=391625 RepID=A6G842_9BACT|nr:AMP-dependent synthetase/ligase [Plesiocystis pacifica]EDM78004.1 AMP-dependent synthetase and ligase [Plesiocystis pacifica SIR-1]